MQAGAPGWRFFIDQGGTFTDVLGLDPAGRLHVTKLLSDDPARYPHAPLEGIRRLMGVEALTDAPLDVVRMGTTKATNALLERRGEPFALVTNRGLEDVLAIGYQERPDIFALDIQRPPTLPEVVRGVAGRRGPGGEEVEPLDLAELDRVFAELRAQGLEAVALLFLHAYADPSHEQAAAARARAAGFTQVSASHEVANEIQLVGRGDTTCVDAYLTPVLRRYLEDMESRLPEATRLFLMQSSGGLAAARHFSGKNAVLSGPAGGVVAVAQVAAAAGADQAIGFDMGGTSTDVSRWGGDFARSYETRVAGVRLKAPMLEIVTVAAGGGSCLGYEGGRFLVGPESAGADPGPACYGKGGPLALTDANLVLGRIQAEAFPRCFGPGGDAPVDRDAARAGLAAVADAVRAREGLELSPEEVALGFVRIANEHMAEAIEQVSVARGFDVRDHALVAFGGAAGQHAAALARHLGMRRVLLHPLAGVLSAFGIGQADLTHEEVAAAPVAVDAEGLAALAQQAAPLADAARAQLVAQGAEAPKVEVALRADVRVRGVDQTLTVDLALDAEGQVDAARLRADFEAAHARLYGFVQAGADLEVRALRALASARAAGGAGTSSDAGTGSAGTSSDAPADGAGTSGDAAAGASARPARTAEPATAEPATAEPGTARICFPGPRGEPTWREVPSLDRAALAPGARVTGPALLREAIGTIVLDPGWEAEVLGDGTLSLRDEGAVEGAPAPTARDPIRLELFQNLFMSVAEQMGHTLERVAHSTNIKERLDFSCALFDAEANLIANAPHIPVHLGAMGATVRAVREAAGADLAPGDVLASNDPFHGGSHLPDVTVVTPVFGPDGGPVRFWVANRGHHSDIGGVTPGSMPPFSRSIDEEGIRLHAFRLVRGGQLQEAALRAALGAGPYPARNPDERLSDLRAQVAANQTGVRLLGELEARHGHEVLAAYMGHVLDNGEEAVRELLDGLPDGRHAFLDHLDEGHRIQLTFEVDGDRARLDFAGTDPQVAGNLNAPRAVVEAAVLYALRCLAPRSLPLNAGCLRPVEVSVPAGSLLDPAPPAAVVGGNVETSQRVVDVIFGALGKLAACQGTMNNLTFGTEAFGYYETVCGGAGAGLGFDGADAVHTHMTNTRITDPEVLERRYPMRVRQFSIRRGSGGRGTYQGGDGVRRELEALGPMRAALLGERRALAPFGLHGAGAGGRGRNARTRGDQVLELPGKARLELEAGDRLLVETPGGGGYEPTAAEWAAMAPAELRRLCRLGRLDRPTAGRAVGRVQANLLVLPSAFADDFEAFCRANPRPCPLLERLAPGDPHPRDLAHGADLRTDLPRYRVYRDGAWAEAADLHEHWRPDAVAFLLGCSFTFEAALTAAGLAPGHVRAGRNVPMFRTDRPFEACGPFQGQLVVSLRWYHPEDVDRVTEISGRFPRAHGAPVHVGDPEALGIADLAAPEWGDAVLGEPGQVPMFWACGVTSQAACLQGFEAGTLPWFLSHAPGHMFVADMRDVDLEGP